MPSNIPVRTTLYLIIELLVYFYLNEGNLPSVLCMYDNIVSCWECLFIELKWLLGTVKRVLNLERELRAWY